MARWDETWHRLREWTNGQAPSERLAAQVLLSEGFGGLDPTHPLGGPDGGKDAICLKHGLHWVMAVHFPRGQQSMKQIAKKFGDDLAGVSKNGAAGIVFVTNQELTEGERRHLCALAGEVEVELYHLERLVAVLDQPSMRPVRDSFLGVIDLVSVVQSVVRDAEKRLEAVQTGGDTFCYWMLYHFDLSESVAHNFVVSRVGDYPMYDVRLRIRDLDAGSDVFQRAWGEISSPAEYFNCNWLLPQNAYYRAFFSARNGMWHQDLQLRRSDLAECWLAATRVSDRNGRDEVFRHVDNGYVDQHGEPIWRD